jgi:glycosyltransferase involved in cell wall biosynthesis
MTPDKNPALPDGRPSEAVRTLVISGVNMNEGGILSVLRNVTEAAERSLDSSWRIVVLAHRQDIVPARRSEVREFPRIKSSWFRRMWFEMVSSRKLSRELSAEVWLAMHDITPLVDAKRQYVYCHNPTCFARPTLRSLYFDWIFVAHSLLYGLLYSLNIRRNAEVFVQQAWIRQAFIRRFGARSVTVSRPSQAAQAPGHGQAGATGRSRLLRWVYPTFARHFKNVELIGDALELLEREGDWQGEVSVTIAGDENRYGRWLKRRYGHLKTLKLIGRQTAAQMQELYSSSDGLLFPSKLETWGLPITEAQAHGLPMLVADLDYARETVGSYQCVDFVDPEDPAALARQLRDLARGEFRLGSAVAKPNADIPVLVGWDALIAEVCRA